MNGCDRCRGICRFFSTYQRHFPKSVVLEWERLLMSACGSGVRLLVRGACAVDRLRGLIVVRCPPDFFKFGKDCVSYRGGGVAADMVCGEVVWCIFEFRRILFGGKYWRLGGSRGWGDCGGHGVFLGVGERGVHGMELSSFMYPRARAHYARVRVCACGGRLSILISVF